MVYIPDSMGCRSSMPSEESTRRSNTYVLGGCFTLILGGLLAFGVLSAVVPHGRKNWPDAPEEYASGTVRVADYGNKKILVIYPREMQKPLVYVCGTDFSDCVSQDKYLEGLPREYLEGAREKIGMSVDAFYTDANN